VVPPVKSLFSDNNDALLKVSEVLKLFPGLVVLNQFAPVLQFASEPPTQVSEPSADSCLARKRKRSPMEALKMRLLRFPALFEFLEKVDRLSKVSACVGSECFIRQRLTDEH